MLYFIVLSLDNFIYKIYDKDNDSGVILSDVKKFSDT